MAFLVGSTQVIDNSGNHISAAGSGNYAYPTGFQIAGGGDVGNTYRYTTYTDDKAANCRGYLPNGNCQGNSLYNVPNGNWWTWGVSGVPTGNCISGGGNANCTNTLYAVSVAFVYDGYYELYNRVRGSEQHRNYSHCNCGNCVGNCYTNCNCNCNC
jgi:hypothetical protein